MGDTTAAIGGCDRLMNDGRRLDGEETVSVYSETSRNKRSGSVDWMKSVPCIVRGMSPESARTGA